MAKMFNVITLDSLEERIAQMEIVKQKLNCYAEYQFKNLNEEICAKYIEFQSVHKVAEYLNLKNYRIKSNGVVGERKYKSNDVSDILRASTKNIDVDSDLHMLAKTLFNYNKGKIQWYTVVKEFRKIK